MNWLRARRRYIVTIAALAIVSLAMVRYACPWPLDVSDASAAVAQAPASPMSASQPCGHENCTYTDSNHAAPDQTLLTILFAPLWVAVFFFAAAAIPLAAMASWRARTFPRLPGYPPILEFYRLRI
ncbi:MAG TPA: hypothetical protein VGA88_06945 [Burkholderiales bacterium]